ncbi:MAG: HAD-IIB family hydrolase [Candidatus Bathyarchaeota archaeon]|jgi:sucrose-6F-phosphate phosphohydrolase
MKYLLVCDLDDTLTGDKKGVRKFNEAITSKKFCLAYSSGRYKSSMTSLIVRAGLTNPDFMIANLGTEIYCAPNWDKDEDWEKTVKKSWKKEKITSILEDFDLQRQPYDKKFVIPYYAEDEAKVKEIEEKIRACNAKVVHTGKRFLDILPESAGKGNAAKYLGSKLKLPIICCGDSENDEEMLEKSDYGILVGNAPVHLRTEMSKHSHVYVAESFYVMGVIDGLRHHGVIS